jgi:hypothetical protein
MACVASISQILMLPLVVLYQRMSLKPSPLKSPTPASAQSGPIEPRPTFRLIGFC